MKKDDTTSVCFYFEVHQPFRLRKDFHVKRFSLLNRTLFDQYFDDKVNKALFNRIAEKCYFPANEILLKKIDQFKKDRRQLKVSFGLTGIFLEQCERYNPDLLESFKQLVETGCVELLNETYYHSISSLYTAKREEFLEQVALHQQIIQDLFNYTATAFINTECLFNNSIARTVEELGYKVILTEGVDWVLDNWKSPNYVYKPPSNTCKQLRILLRNYKLTDDIAFRFSSRNWSEWPLTAGKYASWLSSTSGQCINLFMDYETFGEHHWDDSGIHWFLLALPDEILKYKNLDFATPSEIAEKNSPVGGEISIGDYDTISWADERRSTESWIGNWMQHATYHELLALEKPVKELGDNNLLEIWRYLQASDHLYYIATFGGGPGEVHSYFSPYYDPFEAYAVYTRILSDFARVVSERRNQNMVTSNEIK
ncbi:MAG: glycoside hydrolase family 57 protein [Candidatus Lokiarchaeota archaeon]|nr:glycoside hydrolase family 57 protein [Candidatus Lokiarchaeota archaeon]